MKKNLRIVSAAAALLAVAPIATVAVSNNSAVVQAADATQSTNDYSHINLGGQPLPSNYVANINPNFTLAGANGNIAGSLTGSLTASALGVSATANLFDGSHGAANVKLTAVNNYTITNNSVNPATSHNVTAGEAIYNGDPATAQFNYVKSGEKYQLTVNSVGFNFGANNAGKKVTLALPNNGNFNFVATKTVSGREVSNLPAGWTVTTSKDGKAVAITGNLDNNGTVNGLQVQETLTALDVNNQNNVVFYNIGSGEKVTEGTAMVLANYDKQLNVSALLDAVKSNYTAVQLATTQSSSVQNGSYNQNVFNSIQNGKIKLDTTADQLKEQLDKAGIQVNANGDFKAPHSFKVTVKATSTVNNKSAELPVTFEVANVPATKTEEKGLDKTIMHNAYYYDKDGQRVGKGKITRYETVSVVDKLVSINGQSYYKLANTTIDGKDVYVNADNIDGTKRTLKHNAYVYATSKKRANKEVLKKGTEVTTYGAPYTFKNGKKYYKINNDKVKTYVKASNF